MGFNFSSENSYGLGFLSLWPELGDLSHCLSSCAWASGFAKATRWWGGEDGGLRSRGSPQRPRGSEVSGTGTLQGQGDSSPGA